jgi:hypothetical protein
MTAAAAADGARVEAVARVGLPAAISNHLALAPVFPLWEQVSELPAENSTTSMSTTPSKPARRLLPAVVANSVPPLRFFVAAEDEFERLYEQASVEVHWEQMLGA